MFSDVSCDVTNPHSVFPIYDHLTSFVHPTECVAEQPTPLEVIAIDHLPSLVPRFVALSSPKPQQRRPAGLAHPTCACFLLGGGRGLYQQHRESSKEFGDLIVEHILQFDQVRGFPQVGVVPRRKIIDRMYTTCVCVCVCGVHRRPCGAER